jgi:hypothetical protein
LVMKTSIRGHGMLLFIGVLLPDHEQQVRLGQVSARKTSPARLLQATGPQARKGEGGWLCRSASAGSCAEKKKKEGGLDWLQGELGFGPSPSRIWKFLFFF